MTINQKPHSPFLSCLFLPFMDFIYPPICFTCDQRRTNRASKICESCWRSIARIDATDATWKEIRARFEEEQVVEGMLSCFLFEREGKLQEVIHLLKYGGLKSIGVEIGNEIGRYVNRNDRFRDADYCVPVPLHKLKLRERGYNQSVFLCQGIFAVTGIPVRANLLIRTKATQTQTELKLEERKRNVGNAFAIRAGYRSEIEGKKCLLVDDVITTGSTITACARELLNAGALNVYAISAALAK